MSSEDSEQNIFPARIEGPLSPDYIAQYFTPHSDLTYRRIINLMLNEVNVFQSLLTGSLIRECSFSKVIFSRSDLDGLRAEQTTFTGCDFTSCDIRSSIFAKCTFNTCTFDASLVDDCEFQTCDFVNCSFAGASLTHCRFQTSYLNKVYLKQSSFLHNKLYNCTISDTILGDCTLLFVILRECELSRISINVDSFGAIFGLTKEQLSQAKILYLGSEESVPPESDLLALLSEEYVKRRWYIGQLVLAVNFGLASPIAAFDAYLALSFKRFTEYGFAKGDELEFLGDLLHEMAFRDCLPLLVLLTVLEWCTSLEDTIQQGNQTSSNFSGDSIRVLASRIALLTNSLLQKLDNALPKLNSLRDDRPLCVKFTFQQKPDIDIAEVLNSINATSKLNSIQESCLIRVEGGSYVEIVWTTLLSVLAFQIFLFLLNGCIVQLTELKQRVKILTRKKAPKTYQDMALVPIQQTSPLMLSVLNSLAGYVKGLSFVKDISLSGLNTSNTKSLQEVNCEALPEFSQINKRP